MTSQTFQPILQKKPCNPSCRWFTISSASSCLLRFCLSLWSTGLLFHFVSWMIRCNCIVHKSPLSFGLLMFCFLNGRNHGDGWGGVGCKAGIHVEGAQVRIWTMLSSCVSYKEVLHCKATEWRMHWCWTLWKCPIYLFMHRQSAPYSILGWAELYSLNSKAICTYYLNMGKLLK